MQPHRSKSHVENTVCPYCQTPIRLGENTVVCSCCKMPHHLECWIENGQCTTYGCRGERMANAGIRSHRKQQLPLIEITFEEPSKNTLKSGFKGHAWKVAVLVAFLLGGSYYLYRFL